MAYAAGTLDEAFCIVAASHIAWCASCRAAVREAERLGGEMLGLLEETHVSADCRARTLAALDSLDIVRAGGAAPATTGSGELPGPLARILGSSNLADIPWKRKAPGVALHDVKLSPGAKGQLKLLRIAAGRAMPEHGHGGEEVTLVLKGAYHDHLGRFARGDVADLDRETEHQPVADGDEECICLVAIERPTRFKSFGARLLQPFVGI